MPWGLAVFRLSCECYFSLSFVWGEAERELGRAPELVVSGGLQVPAPGTTLPGVSHVANVQIIFHGD